MTLLISRSDVVPLMTRSTADSRRNRIPSSRAAFLISEVGRFSRISSRMWSVRSSSSQIAVAALVAGAAALDAADAFVEGVGVLERGIERRFLEHHARHLRRTACSGRRSCATSRCAMHAVERRHELIGLDAHVEEAPEHVEHVVRVHGGEDEVPGQRRVDGDLRRFDCRGSRRP